MHLRTALTAAVVTACVVGTAGPALADDCFNASRSSTGNTSAGTHSGTWWSIPEILVALGGLSQDQVNQVMPVVEADPRIPDDLTVFYNPRHPGELARSVSEAIATDGRGIDHSDDYATPVFAALFEDVGIALGG